MKVFWWGLTDFRTQAIQWQNHAWSWSGIPWAGWTVMSLMAVMGSLIYGYALVTTAGLSMGWEGGVLVAVPAGLGWCVLGLALLGLTKRHPIFLAQVCLVSMFWGEIWLLCGAVLNLAVIDALGWSDREVWFFNGIWILLSNLLMFFVWSVSLIQVGESWRKLLFLWLVVLNGTGLLAFFLLRSLWRL
ncbi:MAG: hypothetical protein HC904_00425 [Blastochloris sp.]|nr:hypothetical protein [Blastochloris sp.]